MPRVHVVQQGEHLSRIAEQYGFRRFDTIWMAAENAELRAARKNAHVLLPGDSVVIPDLDERIEASATGRRHVFVRLGRELLLRIAVLDHERRPIGVAPCTLEIDGEPRPLETDSSGKVEARIRVIAEEGRIACGDVDGRIRIGHLDPVDQRTGVEARLNNLGYEAGPVGESDDAELRSAVEEFQCDMGLPVTGEPDAPTSARLLQEHGC